MLQINMLSEQYAKKVGDFFDGISSREPAYKHSGLSYLAIRQDEAFVITQARLFLRADSSSPPAAHFQSKNIRAGYYPLGELGGDPRKIVEQLLGGRLSTPHGELQFPPEPNGYHSAIYIPFYKEGLQNGRRIDVLLLTGVQRLQRLQDSEYDWELKAAPTPFDSLNELRLEYVLGESKGEFTNVEVVAFNVCETDLSAQVRGTKAPVGILLADGLKKEKCRLGYRVFHQGRVVTRSSIDGSAMRWERRESFHHGSTDIEVKEGAVLHCTATYDGLAQHQGWIADPSTVQNPYRAVYEAFDFQATILREFLESSQSRGREARDLEAGVSWLLWMLGFGVAHLGATAKTQDAPDLVATTPRGHFLVVECTTGLLKAENKLARLIERSELLRRRLDASGNRHLRILPAIVTSKSRDDIKADLEQAERLGVFVVTKESLQDALARTLVLPDAETIYAEAETAAREAQDRYARELPFP